MVLFLVGSVVLEPRLVQTDHTRPTQPHQKRVHWGKARREERGKGGQGVRDSVFYLGLNIDAR